MRSRLLVVACLLFSAPTQSANIAVDVGHFLEKPGAISARGVTEFEYNRTLAIDIASALERAGHTVMLIGADGTASDLAARSPRARRMDLFVSVHHDSVQPRFLEYWEFGGERRHYSDRFAGYSLFVSRRSPRLRESLACASAIGAALRKAGFTASRYHADPVLGENRAFADELNGVHYFDNLAVLKTAAIPALLFEAGVIVNREEEMRMRDPLVRTAIANSMVEAVAACLPSRGSPLERSKCQVKSMC